MSIRQPLTRLVNHASKVQTINPWLCTTTTTTTTATSYRNHQQSIIRSLSSSSSSSSSSNDTQRRINKPKLRTHAVNILGGDYSDFHLLNSDYPISGEDSIGRSVPLDENEQFGDNTLDEEKLAKDALQWQEQEDAKKKKWIENAKPKVREVEIDERGRSYGRGGRKSSTARVWVMPGEGVITINRRTFLDYFPRESDRELIISPFVATETCGKFDVIVHVESGGVTGKAGAVRHGIARALEKYNPDYRPPLKKLGYLTRDRRVVESKKIGLKKARKAPQWVRR